MQKIRAFAKLMFLAAVFVTGYGAGMCVKVFMVRGVPVINGGGEIMLLFIIPAAFYIGYRSGVSKRDGNDKTGGVNEDETN